MLKNDKVLCLFKKNADIIKPLHNTDDEILTAEVAEKINNSITLAEEAQKLAP
ncbi:MAG: hypothetical protein ACOX8P_04325 [Tepidanaerobacteraceae bacterium]|jgi:hypothetical protein